MSLTRSRVKATFEGVACAASAPAIVTDRPAPSPSPRVSRRDMFVTRVSADSLFVRASMQGPGEIGKRRACGSMVSDGSGRDQYALPRGWIFPLSRLGSVHERDP